MVFSSLEFLFLYFAASIMLYFIVPLAFRNVVLLIVSLAFYGWGEPIYVILMLFSAVFNYLMAIDIRREQIHNKTGKRG